MPMYEVHLGEASCIGAHLPLDFLISRAPQIGPHTQTYNQQEQKRASNSIHQEPPQPHKLSIDYLTAGRRAGVSSREQLRNGEYGEVRMLAFLDGLPPALWRNKLLAGSKVFIDRNANLPDRASQT